MFLWLIEFKEIHYVSFGHDQHMEIGNRVTILDSKTELVLQKDGSGLLSRTERAGLLTMGVRFAQRSEVSSIPIPLHRITAVTESLQVGFVVAPPMVPRKDMINFESSISIRDATKFAAGARSS